MSKRQQRRRASRRRTHMAVAGGGLAAVATLGGAGVANAAQTFTVTNLNDSGPGSLRQAIQSVNTDTGDTSAPGDTINFASGLTGTITLTSGELELVNPAQIVGPGAGTITVEAQDTRVLGAYADATVSGLTLTGGGGGRKYGGGVVYAEYNFELDHAVVSGGTAEDGGGILGEENLTVIGSTLSGNTAVGSTSSRGGAIEDFGTLTITGSTITGNTAQGFGGAVYSEGYTTNINNSTIARNSAASGAGVASFREADQLTGDTITGGSILPGGSGGQVYVGYSTSTLAIDDSIVAGSGSVPDVALASGVSASASFSLIRNASASSSGNAVSTDTTDITGVDPQLGPLGNNGGPTQTMVPLPTSPALERGKSFGLTTDQRGLRRPYVLPTITTVPAGGDHSDIGAVEVETPAVAGVGPAAGTTGTQVTIGGIGFTGATQVLFGTTPATSFAVQNDGTITAVAPVGAGTDDVRVITPLGESPAVSADRFTFAKFLPKVGKAYPLRSGNELNTGIVVSCPANGFSCSGHFKATGVVGHYKSKLASGSISVAPGKSKTLKLRLGAKAMKQLKSSGRLKITIQVVIADGSEPAIKVNRSITLRVKVKHKKH